MQIVIDTNIVVSAFLNPNGNCYLFLDRVFAGCYDVVVSESIMAEYKDVLSRPKFGFSEDEIAFVLEWFNDNAIFVEVDKNAYQEVDIIDKRDAPFYVVARATHSRLVTGNIKHYPVEEMRTMIWELI